MSDRRADLQGDATEMGGVWAMAADEVPFPSVKAQRVKNGVICDIGWLSTYIAFEHYCLVELLHKEYGFDIIDTRELDFNEQVCINQLNSYNSILVAYQCDVDIPLERLSCYKSPY